MFKVDIQHIRKHSKFSQHSTTVLNIPGRIKSKKTGLVWHLYTHISVKGREANSSHFNGSLIKNIDTCH